MAQSNETTIEQMNEVIARFMGGVKQIIPEGGLHGYKEGTVLWMCLFSDNADPVRLLEYQTSWDWLMPVVEKIEQLNDDIVVKIYTSINGKSCSLWNYFDVKGILRQDSELNCPFSQRYTGKTKIEAVHKAVYQFIKWLNQQKQNNEQ